MSFFFFSSRRRHTRYIGDWSSDVCSSDLMAFPGALELERLAGGRFGERPDDADRLVAPGDLQAQDCERPIRRGERSEERRVGKEGRGGGEATADRKK